MPAGQSSFIPLARASTVMPGAILAGVLPAVSPDDGPRRVTSLVASAAIDKLSPGRQAVVASEVRN
jgi:hypothetical protein